MNDYDYDYDYDSSEYLDLKNKIAKFTINLSETDDDKVKIDITITSDDISPINITRYYNSDVKYDVVLDTNISNYNPYASIMLDDIKVIDNQNATVLIDDGFDVLPVVDGTDIYNFTSAL